MVHQKPIFEVQNKRCISFPVLHVKKLKHCQVLFIGIWNFGRERDGVLGFLLNTHPLALKHLMSSLMHFYIGPYRFSRVQVDVLTFNPEVEQTGASSQFYDKFSKFYRCSH